jgi:hypothetical protein
VYYLTITLHYDINKNRLKTALQGIVGTILAIFDINRREGGGRVADSMYILRLNFSNRFF